MKKSSDKRLFTNVLGNKLGLLPKLSQHYTTVVEPYGGSAAISLNMPNVKHIFIGETDTIMYVGYTNWLSGNLRVASQHFAPSDNQDLFNAAHKVLSLGHIDEIAPSIVHKAFILRQSVFGGIMRLNNKGEINVSLATDKLKRTMKRPVPDRPKASMEVFVDAACTMVEYVKDESTLLVLDPPYYNPGSTPCYPGHNPKNRGETEQAIMYLQQGVADGVDVLFSAYLDDNMLQFVDEVVAQSLSLGYTVEKLSESSLLTLKHKDSKQNKPKEHVLYFQKLDFDSIC
jgi:site-specific DNA-adenine methylase